MCSSSIKDPQREDFSFEAPGLYVHVPFCASRCRYCDFVVTTASGASVVRRYLDALSREAARQAPLVEGRRLETVYFGGGTPSRLEPEAFQEIAELLCGRFVWPAQGEWTLEANPEDVDDGRLRAWRKAGVSRISLGAQSFKDESLRHAGRVHDAARTQEAVSRLRGAGFVNLNLDLILSLPGESVDDVRRSVDRLIGLSPEHVSLYELVIEPRTVFGKWYGRDSGRRVGAIHE